MPGAPARPSPVIVVLPANDRPEAAAAALVHRIRWLVTGRIGRARR